MRKLIFLLTFFLGVTVLAQQKDYVNYTVKEGESVKAIAKKFGLKYKQIYNANPGLKRKPKTNSVIVLPNITPSVQALAVSDNLGGKYELHTVQAKETLFGIAQLYNVSMNSLQELNSEILTEGLKVGAILSIPTEKKITPEEAKMEALLELAKSFELHTVVKDDTLYSLTKKYQVTEAELTALNPELVEGLKLGMVLKIKPIATSKAMPVIVEEVLKDTIAYRDTLQIGMLLPFKFTKNDTLTKEQLFTSRNNLISIITDFYLGAEIAIDSLQNKGAAIKLKVVDTENDFDTIKKAISTPEFQQSAVVFGPVFNKHVDYVAREMPNTPVVFPFYSSKQQNLKSENVVTTVTSRAILKEKVLNYFSQIYTNEKIVLIGDEKLSSKKELIEIRNQLKELHDSVKEVALLRPMDGYISKERFVEAVDTLGINWVILATNDKVATADAINNLKSIPNDPAVRLFAFEKAQNFDKVDNNLLASLDFAYASSGIENDTIPAVIEFYDKFFAKNNGYPSEYAIKGFDVVYDVVSRLLSNDSLSLDQALHYKTSRVGNSFQYQKDTLGNPARNSIVYLQKYQADLTIEMIDEKKCPSEVLTDTILNDTLHRESIPTMAKDSSSVSAEKILLELDD